MQEKLYSIQALRGLGAFAVVIHHALSLFPFMNFRAGAAGVDLFFVISGIVMSISITEKTKPLEFFVRRVIRIAPMYWIATTIAVGYFILRYDMSISTNHIVSSYLFLPPPAEFFFPILYPGWTLNFEMFFYIILSVLLIINKNTTYTAICILLAIGSLSKNLSGAPGAYYLTEGIAEFATGLIIGQLIKSGYRPKKAPSVILIASSIAIFAVNNTFKAEGFLAWGIPSALLIIGCLGFDSSKFMKSKIVQFFGEASYSTYLFHALVIWAIDWYTPNEKSVLHFALGIVLSMLVGAIAFKALEQPLLKLMMRPLRRKTMHH